MAEIIITSSILILVLILLRKLCWGKISRRLQYGLWLLVVVRLLVPAQFFTSSLSVMQVINYAGEAVHEQWQLIHTSQQGDAAGAVQLAGMQGGEALQDKTANDTGGRKQSGAADLQAENRQPGSSVETQSGEQTQSGVQSEINRTEGQESLNTGAIESGVEAFKIVLFGIYVVGVLTIAGCLIVCNLRFRRQLAAGRRLIGQEGRLKVYLAEQMESPCLCGILAPAVYMNEAGLLSEERKQHILLHEMTHYKHLDHVWAVVRSVCLVLYWFHPLVWVAAVLSIEDSELACDEGTLIQLGEENRQAYGRTLIEMMTAKTKRGQLLYCATGMINGKKEIKRRITAIAAYKKQMVWTAVLVVVFALLLSACTAGTASEENDASGSEGTVGREDSSSSSDEWDLEDGVVLNDDGSFRLSEYEVDLTNDKMKERIVFDVFYWGDIVPESGMITEELLWDNLWQDCEVVVKVLEGSETKEQETILQEYSFSDAHAGNGNLAVVRYEGQMCLLRYSNAVYQGTGQLEYQVWQIMPSGSESVLRAEDRAPYEMPYSGNNDADVIAKVLEVGEELDDFLSGSYYTEILLNATVNGQDNCYLYGSEEGLLNGSRRQNAFDVFMAEVGGTGFELKLQDYFYPDGMESMTQLPENAEERILTGEIICMEVSQENNTAGRLDVDGDGEKEVLYLDAVGDAFDEDGWRDGIIDKNYRLRVDDQYYEDYCDIMYPVVMAYSPDGEQILLALYDDGPSGDPETFFFRCDDTGVYPAGNIPCDLSNMEIDNNRVMHGTFRGDMIQTQFATAEYYWNGNEIVRKEEEIYYYLDDSKWRESIDLPLQLLLEITVYEERSESSEAVVMKPQEIQCVASDMKEWVLLEAKDGTKGWIKVEQFTIPSLDNKTVYEVFDGLNMVD